MLKVTYFECDTEVYITNLKLLYTTAYCVRLNHPNRFRKIAVVLKQSFEVGEAK